MDRNEEGDLRTLGTECDNGSYDRLATVKTILRGTTLTSFETAIAEAKTVVAEDGSTSKVPLTTLHV